MPYKHINYKIKREDDKRVKLSLEDREQIKREYPLIKSQRKLAKKWGVSRRLIQFILDPAKKERDLELRRLNGGSKQYYNKEKFRLAMQKHRRRKQKLYLKGKLVMNNE